MESTSKLQRERIGLAELGQFFGHSSSGWKVQECRPRNPSAGQRPSSKNFEIEDGQLASGR